MRGCMKLKSLGRVGASITTVVLLMILAGCGPRNTRYFPRLKDSAALVAEKNNITVSVHMLSRIDCDDYFGIDVIAEGYTPLVLTVKNHGADSYILRPSYFALPRVSGKEISRLMHYDTYQRVAWLTIPALIYFWQAIPLLIVPYGLSCRHYNDKTTRNIRKKTWGRSEVLTIAPYETVQKFIFIVDEAFTDELEIKLYNETTRTLEVYAIDVAGSLR